MRATQVLAAIALAAASVIVGQSPARASLVGYWDFGDSANLGADSSGNNYTLNVYGGATAAAGGGVVLDGTGYLQASAYASNFPSLIPTGNQPYTLEAQFATTAQALMVLVQWGWGSASNANALSVFTAGSPTTAGNNWWGPDLNYNSSILNNGQEHELVASWDGTTRDLYLDGTLVASDTPTQPNVVGANFDIGRATWYGTIEYFIGTIYDVAVFNTALTAAQVNTALDITLSGNDVPEPASLTLLVGGVGGLAVSRRRRMLRI